MSVKKKPEGIKCARCGCYIPPESVVHLELPGEKVPNCNSCALGVLFRAVTFNLPCWEIEDLKRMATHYRALEERTKILDGGIRLRDQSNYCDLCNQYVEPADRTYFSDSAFVCSCCLPTYRAQAKKVKDQG